MKKSVLFIVLFSWIQLYGQNNLMLTRFPKAALQKDFDLTVNSLKEAHPGLYWYRTVAEFDSICSSQRSKISDGQNALEFYRILAPVVSASREGHCKISLSDKVDEYFVKKGKYPPLFIKFFDNKPYLINNIGRMETKGQIVSKINGKPIEEIMKNIFHTISSDGFNLTKKYKTLDGQDFAYYYNDVYEQTDVYELDLRDPNTNIPKKYYVHSVNHDQMSKQWDAITKTYPDKADTPSSLIFFNENKTAILTYTTFKAEKYLNFHKTADDYFDQVLNSDVTDLIIDLRNNGGGEEGYEDYLFSYLTSKPYVKYRYVQASSFSYSFYRFSNKKDIKSQKALEESLREEHVLESDGRILRKSDVLVPEKPRKKAFTGNLYVLINGSTYSGGSEFASLIKGNREATFIGEETGGGFYGNTSGFSIELILPNSGLNIKIPLLKFVLDVEDKGIPFGHGVLPDLEVQPKYNDFIKCYDTELEFAKGIIKNNSNTSKMEKN